MRTQTMRVLSRKSGREDWYLMECRIGEIGMSVIAFQKVWRIPGVGGGIAHIRVLYES